MFLFVLLYLCIFFIFNKGERGAGRPETSKFQVYFLCTVFIQILPGSSKPVLLRVRAKVRRVETFMVQSFEASKLLSFQRFKALKLSKLPGFATVKASRL